MLNRYPLQEKTKQIINYKNCKQNKKKVKWKLKKWKYGSFKKIVTAVCLIRSWKNIDLDHFFGRLFFMVSSIYKRIYIFTIYPNLFSIFNKLLHLNPRKWSILQHNTSSLKRKYLFFMFIYVWYFWVCVLVARCHFVLFIYSSVFFVHL